MTRAMASQPRTTGPSGFASAYPATPTTSAPPSTTSPADEALPGDLYFFARPGKAVHHVGFVSEAGMLHASETGGFLEDRPLTPDRLDTLVTAARL